MKLKRVIILLMIVTAPMVASARIGETEETIEKRYGSPTKSEGPDATGSKALHFGFHGYDVTIIISANKSVFEKYQKQDHTDFAEDEKKSFLQKKCKWQQLAVGENYS